MHARPKLGRPHGSKTFRETPAVKRARQFFELKSDGMKPTSAAKMVAAEWQVSESTIFSDYSRHRGRLLAGMKKKMRENDLWFGRLLMQERPDIAAELTRLFTDELISSLSATASRLDAMCNSAVAQWVREYDPATAMGDNWLAIMGRQYRLMCRLTRNKMRG